MSLGVFLWVIGAALLHAGWNALVKTGGDKQSAMLLVAVGNGVVGMMVVGFYPLPAAQVWPWILASGLVRTVYLLALGYAYGHGDLSRVYPIARGTAPLLVLLVGGFFLTDVIRPIEAVGIVVLGLGILLMARGVFTDGESRRLLPFALASAAATAGYSIIDGIGAREMGQGVAFTGWALAATAVFYLPVVLAWEGRGVLRVSRGEVRAGVVAGLASYLAYSIVVWAMTRAPVLLVAGLRETSILFAVLIGWLLFGERMNPGKALAALLIVAGAVLTRL